LVSHIKGGTWLQGIREYCSEEGIWTFEKGRKRRLAEMHDEKLHDLCCSSGTVSVNESRKMRWMTGHAAHRPSDRREMHAGLWWGNLKERARLKYLRVDGRIILK